jgi:hypothetical protein
MDSRLIIHDGKNGTIYWHAADRKQINAAMRALFDLLDAQGCYQDWSCLEWFDQRVKEDLGAARAGEHMPIYRILKARQNVPNETWRVVYAIDPCEPKT